MLKRILAITFALLILISIFAGCSKSSEKTAVPAEAPAADGGLNSNANYGYADVKAGSAVEQKDTVISKSENAANGNAGDANAVTSSGSTGSTNEPLSNAILSQRKIIRNANVSVEVEDFDSAYGRIKTMIAAFGFVQETSIKKDKVYVDGKEKLVTRGTIIIRVDKDRFESVLSDIKGLGTLLNENIKSDDVTDKFFDTESRLRLLRFEESRLEEYLKKITDPDTIFKTESRLTDIRHEIESLTGTLKKWTDLVDLSTITIDMNEKVPGSKPVKEKSYWGKLVDKFTGSVKGVAVFCGELLLVLVQILPALVLLGIILFVIIFLYKKVFRNKYKLVVNKKESSSKSNDNNLEA